MIHNHNADYVFCKVPNSVPHKNCTVYLLDYTIRMEAPLPIFNGNI